MQGGEEMAHYAQEDSAPLGHDGGGARQDRKFKSPGSRESIDGRGGLLYRPVLSCSRRLATIQDEGGRARFRRRHEVRLTPSGGSKSFMNESVRVKRIRVGDDVQSYCGRCKAERAHLVAAMKSDTVPAQVI